MSQLIRKGSELPAPRGSRCVRCFKVRKSDEAPEGYCSLSCHEAEAEGMSQAALRRAVFVRDKGVCALCGEDTLAVRELVNDRIAAGESLRMFLMAGYDDEALRSGWSLWVCDHVREKVAGGPSTLENAQTLCQPCNRAKTDGFARKRANARKVRRGNVR